MEVTQVTRRQFVASHAGYSLVVGSSVWVGSNIWIGIAVSLFVFGLYNMLAAIAIKISGR